MRVVVVAASGGKCWGRFLLWRLLVDAKVSDGKSDEAHADEDGEERDVVAEWGFRELGALALHVGWCSDCCR